MKDASAPEEESLVFVTGPSGGGRSTAINVLEDMGFETIDMLPLSLLGRLLSSPLEKPMALGVAPATRDFSVKGFMEAIDSLKAAAQPAPELLYLDCSPEVLLRRYSETRRRHPSAPDETPMLGIERELELLMPIKERADLLIDTSDLSPHDLKAEIGRWFGSEAAHRLAVTLHSFSYKRGLPRGIDMVFDCRFLRNPYWDATIREHSGLHEDVQAYVTQDPRYAPFFEQVLAMADLLLPAYGEEGKAHLSIGFGCTGGKHRSVTLVEQVAAALAQAGWEVSIRHREIERAGYMHPAAEGEKGRA